MNLPSVSFQDQRWRKAAFSSGFLVFAAVAAYEVATYIINDDTTGLVFVGLAAVIASVVVAMLKNWRNGLMFFLAWLLFEDLARKYLGNSMAIYFGKDVLVAVVYLSFFLAHRRREVPWIRPPFLLPLLIMNWFGVIQIFNPGSPRSIVGYGGQLFLGGNLRISGFSTDARLCNARIANCFPSVYSRSRHHRCVDVSSVVLLLGSSSLPSVFVWALG